MFLWCAGVFGINSASHPLPPAPDSLQPSQPGCVGKKNECKEEGNKRRGDNQEHYRLSVTFFDGSGSFLALFWWRHQRLLIILGHIWTPACFIFASTLPEVPYLCLNIQHLPTSTCMWDFFFNGSVTSHLSHLCSIKLEGGGGHTPDSCRSEIDEVNKSLPIDAD